MKSANLESKSRGSCGTLRWKFTTSGTWVLVAITHENMEFMTSTDHRRDLTPASGHRVAEVPLAAGRLPAIVHHLFWLYRVWLFWRFGLWCRRFGAGFEGGGVCRVGVLNELSGERVGCSANAECTRKS